MNIQIVRIVSTTLDYSLKFYKAPLSNKTSIAQKVKEGDLQGAIEALSKAKKIAPRDKRVLKALVKTYLSAKNYEGVIKSAKDAKEVIKGDLELCVKMNEYRKRNVELQNNAKRVDLFDELDIFEQEYAEFKKDSKVAAFLATELRLCRMMQEVNITIAKNIELELKF